MLGTNIEGKGETSSVKDKGCSVGKQKAFICQGNWSLNIFCEDEKVWEIACVNNGIKCNVAVFYCKIN